VFWSETLDPDLRTMCCAKRQKGWRVCTEARGREREWKRKRAAVTCKDYAK
jgi:hypothetical protein